MPGHQQEGGSSTHERIVNEIMEHIDTGGELDKLNSGGYLTTWRRDAVARYKGKERRTKELRAQGWDESYIISKLYKERYITQQEMISAKKKGGLYNERYITQQEMISAEQALDDSNK